MHASIVLCSKKCNAIGGSKVVGYVKGKRNCNCRKQ